MLEKKCKDFCSGASWFSRFRHLEQPATKRLYKLSRTLTQRTGFAGRNRRKEIFR